MPDQRPIARPRVPAGNAVESSVSVSGVTIAPPAPWRARAAISAPVRRRERGERGGHGEDAEADDEHAPAAEAVAERGARHQQHRVGQRVRVDRPFEVLEPTSEVRADRRQGGRDDEVVEDDHEERDRDDRERPPADRSDES